ncbi:MAG: hypothetical protein AAGI66_06735 [Cyanobacteria bacterium P01_H01_bin.74]
MRYLVQFIVPFALAAVIFSPLHRAGATELNRQAANPDTGLTDTADFPEAEKPRYYTLWGSQPAEDENGYYPLETREVKLMDSEDNEDNKDYF